MALTVTHSTVVAVADDGTSPVGSDEWNDDHAITGTVGPDVGARELLTADRTYYVRTDGSDSNTGLVNNAGGAFLTVQKAADVAAGEIDFAGKIVKIHVGVGSFEGAFFQVQVGGGSYYLEGEGSADTFITTNATYGMCAFVRADNFNITKLTILPSSGDGIYIDVPNLVAVGDFVDADVAFDTTGASGSALVCYSPANIFIGPGAFSISGDWAQAFALFAPCILTDYGTWTATGTPTFSVAFINATANAAYVNAGATYSGAATGARFLSSNNASINTSGGGAHFFPGNAAGCGSNSGTSPYGLYI
jgi:hypothetical protein